MSFGQYCFEIYYILIKQIFTEFPLYPRHGSEDGAGNKKAKIIFLGNVYFCGEIVNKQIYSGVKNKWDNDKYKENTWQGKGDI